MANRREKVGREKKSFCGWDFCVQKPGMALHFKERHGTILVRYVVAKHLCQITLRQNVYSVLRHQPQAVKLPLMLDSRGQEVYPGGFNGAVSQHIRQLYDILAGPIKSCGEQVAQIVGEYLGWFYIRIFA